MAIELGVPPDTSPSPPFLHPLLNGHHIGTVGGVLVEEAGIWVGIGCCPPHLNPAGQMCLCSWFYFLELLAFDLSCFSS